MDAKNLLVGRAPASCGACLFDAGHQCGMAGAARCPLIERWQSGVTPEEWRAKPSGSMTCSAYEAGLLSLDQ